jgi:periplasmic divalent cation tolerance protein
MTDQVILALSSCPDEASAAHIAKALVEAGLATCINRIQGVRSTYFWDGHLNDDAEILLMMKTTTGRLAALEARLKALHPYELPELIALPIVGGSAGYLDWVRAGVATKV